MEGLLKLTHRAFLIWVYMRLLTKIHFMTRWIVAIFLKILSISCERRVMMYLRPFWVGGLSYISLTQVKLTFCFDLCTPLTTIFHFFLYHLFFYHYTLFITVFVEFPFRLFISSILWYNRYNIHEGLFYFHIRELSVAKFSSDIVLFPRERETLYVLQLIPGLQLIREKTSVS